MNTDIDESDCIVVETKGDDVAKRSAASAGSLDPADAGARAPSSEAGNRAVDEGDEAESKGQYQGKHY
jgi:hypothetical protein